MIDALRERVRLLDTRAAPGVTDLDAFIGVLSRITSSGEPREGLPAIPVHVADGIAQTSVLLRRLEDQHPEIVSGPLDRSRQTWIGMPGRGAPSSRPEPPRRRAPAASAAAPTSKPYGYGLFTSTALAESPGMWERSIARFRGSDLFPEPWEPWRLEVASTAAVYEVSSARAWYDLVATYPRRHEGLVYPNWARIAEDWNGVHMTLRAIVATQGVCLSGALELPTAPTYWDVESTFWLTWAFDGVRRATDPEGGG